MAKRRKSTDPQATRYRIAVTALAKAERRKAAADKAIRELTRKVRYYERTLSPARRQEIAAGTKQRREAEAMRKERWKDAERTLRAAAKVAGINDPVRVLLTKGKVKRRYGMAVRVSGAPYAHQATAEDRCLVWDFRDGFKAGRWGDRENRRLLDPLTESAALAWRDAA